MGKYHNGWWAFHSTITANFVRLPSNFHHFFFDSSSPVSLRRLSLTTRGRSSHFSDRITAVIRSSSLSHTCIIPIGPSPQYHRLCNIAAARLPYNWARRTVAIKSGRRLKFGIRCHPTLWPSEQTLRIDTKSAN
jgi:hypothetical protein